jgi:hypothetical protein
MELADEPKKLRPVLILCTCKLRSSTQTLARRTSSMYIASFLSWSKVGFGRSTTILLFEEEQLVPAPVVQTRPLEEI